MKKILSICLALRCSSIEAFMSQSRGLTSKPNTIHEPFSFVDLEDSRSKSALHVIDLRRSNRLIGDGLRQSPDISGDDLRQLTDTAGDNDSAYFSLKDQRLEDWVKFSLAVGLILAVTSYAWFIPSGPQMGDSFLSSVQGLIGTTAPDVTIFVLLIIFAIAHSGLAGLRIWAEQFVGARVWRVIFATVSLPLSLSCISYFVNHCHEGTQLWDLRSAPGHEYIHAACFVTDFVSFLLLYPGTFNLLEVAAIEKPKMHLWETGVMRITRHPQAVGQVMWCTAHSAWLGSSTALAASSVLVAHHLFSMWHGDARLEKKHGAAFEAMKEKTSIMPFQAIIEGRQILPDDYYKEFLRGPYALVVFGTLSAYYAHPYMMAGAAMLHW
mmetsp:Transcript_5434/g.6360  ORF Transcript_5434/g.6360 Transcript_5434/m.6360 type:complete len:381 (+) Transcript_5434:74-1216(+)